MEFDEKDVQHIKNNLARMAKQKKTTISARELIHQIAPEIHARLSEGHGLQAIWQQIFENLPKKEQITFGTFKKYWQNSREELGIHSSRKKALPGSTGISVR